MNLCKQLEEIQILQCSLLPPELFAFVLPPEDTEEWDHLIQDFTEDGKVPDDDWRPTSTCRFEVRVQGVPIWFEIELPRQYPEGADPLIYIRGDNIQRGEQERWQALVNERLNTLKEEGADCIVQSLLCLYLIPLLHEEAQALQSTSSAAHFLSPTIPNPTTSNFTSTSAEIASEIYHVLFTSHHLISSTKRRNMQKWSGELSLRGFAKVGYPGVIYAEGTQADVTEFVSRVKAMQWLALKVRFEENLDMERYGRLNLDNGDQNTNNSNEREGKGRWIELEKVGGVVELMRRSRREEFVTEMGLGSSSNSSVTRSSS